MTISEKKTFGDFLIFTSVSDRRPPQTLTLRLLPPLPMNKIMKQWRGLCFQISGSRCLDVLAHAITYILGVLLNRLYGTWYKRYGRGSLKNPALARDVERLVVQGPAAEQGQKNVFDVYRGR